MKATFNKAFWGMLLVLALILFSCKAPVYWVQPASLVVSKGKPIFTPTGEKKVMKDTTYENVFLITKKYK